MEKIGVIVFAAIVAAVGYLKRSPGNSVVISVSTDRFKQLQQAGLPLADLQKQMNSKQWADLFPDQKLFVIDGSLFVWLRQGTASDYSYSSVLMDNKQ